MLIEEVAPKAAFTQRERHQVAMSSRERLMAGYEREKRSLAAHAACGNAEEGTEGRVSHGNGTRIKFAHGETYRILVSEPVAATIAATAFAPTGPIPLSPK